MTYIDLDMVRAGAVDRPEQWECCGYREIQSPRDRYHRIDQQALTRLLELPTTDELRAWQRQSVREHLDAREGLLRCPEWTEAVAVGGELYLARVQTELGQVARHRSIRSLRQGTSTLSEALAGYGDGGNRPQKGSVSLQNVLRWQLSS